MRELAGKTILLGLLDSGSEDVETPKVVAARIRERLRYVPSERLVPVPNCGMKYPPRERAFGKLKAMPEGATIVRRELAG